MAILPKALRAIGGVLSDAFLPQDCALCGAFSGPRLLCADCGASLPHLPSPCCRICALPIPFEGMCGACLKDPPHYDATLAPYVYGFPIDRLIKSLKFGHRLAIAHYLGGELAQGADGMSGDVLLPLPLHPRRLAERGFNQAVEIARPLASALGMRLVLDIVVREHEHQPQVRLAWDERRRNVRGAFRCTVDLTGKHVLVVDDVMTTGTTLDELARALKSRGAARVTNLVVARTLPP